MPSFTIDGNPGSVRSKASGMRTHAQTFTQTGDALATITTDGWVSRSGDRFREKFETEPGRWRDAGAGWQRAATALDHFAGELERAQERAEWAEQEYARGEQVTRDARAAYDADVDRAQGEAAQKRAAGFTVDLTILPFHDPGEEVRQGALREYESAKTDLDTAAHDCASEVKAGCADAPEKRKWYEKVGGAVAGFFAGAGEALVDLGKMAYFLAMPHVAIPMMLMDDLNSGMTSEEIAAKYKLKLEDAKAVGEYAVSDPVGFGKTLGKAILDWDTWADDPARAAGRLLPDAVIAVLTAGSGTVATRGSAAVRNALEGLRKMDSVAGLRRMDDVPAEFSRDTLKLDRTDFGPVLRDLGMDEREAIRLLNTPTHELDDAGRAAVNALRDQSAVGPDTVMQKVIQPPFEASYRTGQFPDGVDPGSAGGSTTSAADTAHLGTPEELFKGLRLDYEDTTFDEDARSVLLVRGRIDGDVEAPRTLDMGGPEVGGSSAYDTWGDPFTGNGFTKAENDIIPEWQPAILREQGPDGLRELVGPDGKVLRDDVVWRDGSVAIELRDDGSEKVVADLVDGEWVPR